MPGRGVKAVFRDDARSWVLALACQVSKELGYPNEKSTYNLLKKHIKEHSKNAGYECLSKIDKGVLHIILSKGNIQSHKIRYYLWRRDPEFEKKIANVLKIFKQIGLTNELQSPDRSITTLSYDEQPGIQAIKYCHSITPDS